ncbi:DUF1028 domain-containing protein [Microbacterium sp. AISO3]|uniref:DUF1028 domain-containing protein n=1 Tax=Microbacterium TaxID=33882 RepID=UPI00090339BB|nr:MULTISPECIES: DUF1028 domain-containing protein [Microbacterium]APF33003.1 hypothetical protein BO218_01295 [Microbacterium paludicola]OWP22333.1 DUF1028 domain-containing protein [Microbacterium sp. AISO3]POX66652.1 DUF1028 domain-containing protein [Microbacterium sp. Ru50]QCR40695.1 DUF1028 domain-containing protein [Microbacterium sp. SGAir0570]
MTFTVLARDGRTDLIGAATASKSLAVGNAVIDVRRGVGAAASQAWTNRALRGRLLDAVASGSAADAVALIPRWDDEPALRQAAVLPAAGAGAAHTGADTSPWSGHLVESDLIVAGNLLTGEDVLGAMRDAWLAGDEDPTITPAPDAAAFAARLVAVLAAGEAQGGDRRGRQSAAVMVTSSGVAGDAWVDLRVDDHDDPLAELHRLVELRASDLRLDLSARKA